MRKISFVMFTSLDTFFECPEHDISWHNFSEEMSEFTKEQMEKHATLFFGRVTYELMASYWPTPLALENDFDIASRTNSAEKIVFSQRSNGRTGTTRG
jgi:dihydrofolate reductase